MIFTFVPMRGSCFNINVSRKQRVSELKRRVADVIKIPREKIRLRYNGVTFEDGRQVGDYLQEEYSVVTVIIR